MTKRVYQTGPRFGQQMADRKKREREAVASWRGVLGTRVSA